MKKNAVILFVVLLAVIGWTGWTVWSESHRLRHTAIAIKHVQNIRFSGPSIQTEDGWRHASEIETKQILNWFNSAKYVQQAEKETNDPSAAIIIELKPATAQGEITLERGERIWIVNTDSAGFEIRRDHGSYIADQPDLKQFLNALDDAPGEEAQLP
ncbi:MAG TPA: hypothetical protein VF260_07605 [Bacilli bacterium]